MKDASQTVQLQDRPPSSVNALRYRVAEDIPELTRVLHAYSYYDATITTDIKTSGSKVRVLIFIHPGSAYLLNNFSISHDPCLFRDRPKLPHVSLDKIDVSIGDPATTFEILKGEDLLLKHLAKRGYPLASIDSRKVLVDSHSKSVDVKLCVDQGPLSRFGPVTIMGLNEVDPKFIARKIKWKEGQLYSPKKVKETEKRLLDTELFSSVSISYDEQLDDAGELPIKVRLAEAKHHSISLGASYATVDGFGAEASWSNRNVRGMGEQLSAEFTIAQREASGLLRFRKPDFIKVSQDYVSTIQFNRERITVYLARTFSFLNLIDQQVTDRFSMSVGIGGEYTSIIDSINNGQYTLVSSPILLKYNHANSLMNATDGYKILYYLSPYQALTHQKNAFVEQHLTFDWYLPATSNGVLVLAFHAKVGSILGSATSSIPMTKLFFGGSDEDLRGYDYKTVSPENENGDPTGGRSAVYFTFEPRFRLTEQIGVVPFVDFGNIQKTTYPTWNGKWYKSVGFGLRYFTFFGPLRLDVGFPLNRRKRDNRYRVYLNIGQSF